MRKLITLGVVGVLTVSMSVAAYAQPGGPGGNGGGPGGGGGDRGGARSESHETGGSAPSFDEGSAPSFDGGSAPSFDGSSAPSFDGSSAPSFDGGSAPVFDAGSVPDFGGDSGFMAPSFDMNNMTFNFGGQTYSLENGELTAAPIDNFQQAPSAPGQFVQNTNQEFIPPAGEGEEPPEKPEGDFAPEKPEGDLAPEKPEGDLAPEKPEGDLAPEKPEGEEAPEFPEGTEHPERPEGFPEGMRPVMFDTEALGKAIAALEDNDTVSELTALLEAYTAAMDAEKEALDSEGSDEDTLNTLKLAADDARKALLEALQEAGMDISEYTEDEAGTQNTVLPPRRNNPGQSSDGFMGRAMNAIQSFAGSIGNWFGNMFA